MNTMDRRTYLRCTALAATGSLAGCFGQTSDAAGDPETDVDPGRGDDEADEGGAGSDAGDSWPSFGVDAANTGVRLDRTGPEDAGIRWQAIDNAPTVLCSPTVVDGVVYTGSAADAIHAFDPRTGDELWAYDTTSYVETAPAVRDGSVYAADADGFVYALSTDGEKQWTHETGHNLHSRAVGVVDGLLVVGTAGTMPAVVSGDTDASRASNLLALDVDTGDHQWSVEAADWFSGPAIGGGLVYAGSHTGELFALDPASGDVVWSVRPGALVAGEGGASDGEAGDSGGDSEDAGAILAPPTYRDGRVFVGVHGRGLLVALDSDSGDPAWHLDLKAPNVKSSPAVTADRVYIAAHGTESTDYDAPDEPTTTPTPTPTPTPSDEPAPADPPTFQESGSVFAVPRDGEGFDWRVETDHDVRSSPAVVGDTVYVGGGDACYGLARDDGEERWRVAFGDFVYSSPAVADGRVYIGSADGHLYCLDDES